MTNFEYLILEFNIGRDPNGAQAELNNLGREGWEMVAVGVQYTTHVVYLKRQATVFDPR